MIMTPKASAKKNLLFPGLPNYEGPTKGWFTLLHHEGPILEYSDNVMERIEYIVNNKPADEVETRLAHIVYFEATEEEGMMCVAWTRRHAQQLTRFLEKNVPNSRWDGRELMFAKAEESDGDGSGYGSGYGNGDGSGYGYGNGNGDGSGYGSGNGSGYGYGNGDGSGYGYGDGSGDGSGYGYGNGDGSGYGYGDG